MKLHRSLIAIAALLALALPASAQADFGLRDLDAAFTHSDGSIATQAGSHPFAFTTRLAVNTETTPEGMVPEEEAKDLFVFQMPGLVGSQTAVPKCPSADFNTRIEGAPQCPDSSAVGIVAVQASFSPLPAGHDEYLHVPVYNLEPSPGEAAKLGFVVLNVSIVIDVGVNPEPPHNLIARLRDIPQAVFFYGSKFTIWGNPASPAHDSLRGGCVQYLTESKEPESLGECPVNVSEAPFLTLPRACTGPLATLFTAASWQRPGAFTTPQAALTHDGSIPPNPQGMTGCSELGFGPTVGARPTSTKAESPSGLEVSVEVKDEGLTSVTGTAQSDIRAVRLVLPEGITANPSAAEGLGVCSPAQFAAASVQARGCPESSKLGALTVKTPLLEDTLEGSLYLAAPRDNPFGTLLALYMIIRDPQNGILVKLPVRVEPDPETGRLVSTVENLPQLPFSEFKLRFREGPRAPLTTPPRCGTYAAQATLTPWSGNAPLQASSTFIVNEGPNGSPCPSSTPFSPGFEAGSINNRAGAHSPFYMRLTRQDGEQSMTRFDSVLPPGVTGKIAGLPRCADAALAAVETRSGRAELASPSCPAASQIGRVEVGAGVGPALTWVGGRIYLAGPYGGAPLSVAVIVPAVAGPFDVGTVLTREALRLNPTTGQVEVDGRASDPIPHILAGIPLKVRDLRVHVDRPDFTLNPTSCEEAATRATLFGSAANLFSAADDFPAQLSSRYQAAGCESLGFRPRLAIRLSGGTRRGQHPSLKAVLRPRAGDANIGRAQVTLPRSAFLEQAHIRTICTRVQFAAKSCPPGSVYGTAEATTPLLDGPLKGPVYLRSSDNELPDMVVALKGPDNARVEIDLVGRIDSSGGAIRTTFASPPDAPVSSFVLRMQGGRKGLIANSQNLCAAKNRALVRLRGHNGKLSQTRPVVRAAGCGGKKKSGRGKGRG